MVGKEILFKWDCGWARGKITRRHKQGKNYNYFVFYVEDDGETNQFRQGLFTATYYNEEKNESGIWLMIVPENVDE